VFNGDMAYITQL